MQRADLAIVVYISSKQVVCILLISYHVCALLIVKPVSIVASIQPAARNHLPVPRRCTFASSNELCSSAMNSVLLLNNSQRPSTRSLFDLSSWCRTMISQIVRAEGQACHQWREPRKKMNKATLRRMIRFLLHISQQFPSTTKSDLDSNLRRGYKSVRVFDMTLSR